MIVFLMNVSKNDYNRVQVLLTNHVEAQALKNVIEIMGSEFKSGIRCTARMWAVWIT